MEFRCNFCPDIFPNFKELVEHYEEKHRGKLKRFKIINKPLKQVALVYASNPEEIRKGLGWNTKDCKIVEVNK